MDDKDNELIEDTDNGLEIVGANNELVEDTDNSLVIVDANDNQVDEDTNSNSDTTNTETDYTGTTEECNNVMFDYYKLGYVEMMYIEMNRQSVRIGEIGKKASEQVSDVVSKLESLGSFVDVGVSDCASNLADKITERTQAIQSSMETQIKAHVELNNRLEKNLEYLDSLIDTLFDEDGQQITWKNYKGEVESKSYQDLLGAYVDYKEKHDIKADSSIDDRNAYENGEDNYSFLTNKISEDKYEVIDEMFRFFKEKGLTDEQIAGVIGNAVQESALDISAKNSTSTATGLFQWLDSRQPKEEGWTEDLQIQLEHAWKEMETRTDMSGKTVNEHLFNQSSVEDSTYSFALFFEGYTGELYERKQYAKSVYYYIKNNL